MKTILQIKKLCKRFGPNVLFEDAEASFGEGNKIGVIGRNGAGKSTLFKIVTGQEEADSGQIIKHSGAKISYLEQHDPFEAGETIRDFLMRYTGQPEWKCGKVASSFAITANVFEEVVISSLPGGFQTRVKLAAMMLGEPDFLMLDEPTNYLDLSTLILLEKFLRGFKGGFLIISHDREFLKKTCTHTLEIANEGMTLYPGSVEEYFEFKEEQLEHAVRVNKNVEGKRRELQAFVDRFRAKNTKATQAQSKLKQLQKLKTIAIEHKGPQVNIRLPRIEERNGIALECSDLEIGYTEKSVAQNIQLFVDRGSRIAIVGDNGQGKTTFLRTIAGELKNLAGYFKWSAGLEPAYYAQHVFRSLDDGLDVYTYLREHAHESVAHQDVLDLAGAFMFRGDDVNKSVSVLSGGERARLCLAGILLAKKPVMILDEPTNHLDFETVETLARALAGYTGTLFFTSHDRTFVNLVATGIATVEDGRIGIYPGSYEDYVFAKEQAADGNFKPLDENTCADSGSDGTGNDGGGQGGSKNRKQVRAQLTKLRISSKKLEAQLESLEEEKEHLAVQLGSGGNFSRETYDRFDELVRLIAEKENAWLEECALIEELQQN